MKKVLSLTFIILLANIGFAQKASIKLESLAELDKSATVQFRNFATGEYINLIPDPRGGGKLETKTTVDAQGWLFYQAADAESGNFEIKRVGFNAFNWSAYPGAIAWNHAKRFNKDRTTNNVDPAAPHEWYINKVGNGVFKIMTKKVHAPKPFTEFMYLEVIPNETVPYTNGTGTRVDVRKKTDSDNQKWEIWVDKKISKETNTLNAGSTLNVGEKLISSNGAYALVMQSDGNLCVYSYANGHIKKGSKWCTMKYRFNGAKLIMKADGNLVVYDNQNKLKWSSQTHPSFNPKFKNNKPVKLVIENDGTLTLYTASGVKAWTSN